MHATVVVAVLIAVFYQDFQKRHSSVSGVPTTGAEDASLVSLRTKNPGIFSAFVALGLVSPHALSECCLGDSRETSASLACTLNAPAATPPPSRP